MAFRKLSLFGLAIQCVSAINPLVDLGYSRYQGVQLQNGITQWLGLRFAAPPTGALRFAAPQDPLHNDTLQIADQVRRIVVLSVFFLPMQWRGWMSKSIGL